MKSSICAILPSVLLLKNKAFYSNFAAEKSPVRAYVIYEEEFEYCGVYFSTAQHVGVAKYRSLSSRFPKYGQDF